VETSQEEMHTEQHGHNPLPCCSSSTGMLT
jgi:hypothetical protein